MSALTNFDPVAIGNEIAALETEAQTNKQLYISRSEKIAAILWDVKQNHPEHLDAICERANIGTSRRYELLQIGGGRKTIAQSREETAARQRKFKAKKKKKAEQLAAAETAKDVSVTTAKVTEKDTAQPNKAAKGKSAAKPKKPVTAKPEKAPTPSKSEKALAEFKIACDHWLPHLTDCDKLKAVNYVQVRTGAIPETELAA